MKFLSGLCIILTALWLNLSYYSQYICILCVRYIGTELNAECFLRIYQRAEVSVLVSSGIAFAMRTCT